jgi:branched-chain amino acid transport system ATP-binding protein
MEAIKVSGLHVSRGGKKVLHDLSFTVRPGAITALLGANGAGKSSTVMTMAGVLPADSGTIKLGQHELTRQAPDRVRRWGVALVPEGHRVLRSLSVEDNLLVASPERNNAGRAKGLAQAYEIFPELAQRKTQRAGDLSGGQKQMVAMAQAFIAKPAFMIVDELSLGLAPAIVRRLATTLRQAADGGIGVLLIEQFATLALEISDYALVLERGRKVFDGSPAELKAKPEILHAAYL